MRGSVDAQLPITVWPATPLGRVLVERWALVLGEAGELDWRSRDEPRELPEEWVLRQLFKANLDDDAEVVDLVDNFGAIDQPYFDRAYVPRERRQLLAPSLSPNEQQRADWWENRTDATIEDVRWWLKSAGALAGVWRKTVFGEPAAAAWAAEGFAYLNDERSSWAQFTHALNIGLRPFRAHVEHTVELPGGSAFTLGLPRVGLYSAACRQIFNLIVEDGTARLCENETCTVVFVRQIGGSQKGRYRRTGNLRFCSPACARMQTQRQYRRNQAKRSQHNGKS